MQPTKEVKVESSQSHDRVVDVFLVGYHHVASRIPNELEVVEGREDRLEVGRGDGEERDILDIRVMLGHVGDEVMYVVRGFPPSNAEAAAKVCDEGTNECVGNEIACDTSMTGIVRCEHDLLLRGKISVIKIPRVRATYPKQAQKYGGC